MKKRYLVTYSEASVNKSRASNLLSVSKENLIDGVSILSSESLLEKEILHFEEMGITSLPLTEKEVKELLKKKEILAVEEDFEMFISGFKDEGYKVDDVAVKTGNLWNIKCVKAPQAWKNGYTGKGVNLAILDTGIATHPDLVISGGVSFVPGVVNHDDGNGHGTHCAGIAAGRNGLNKVYGVAKDCNLYAVKVLGDDGRGQVTWIIAGMEWCTQNKISVASMSLEGSNPPSVAYANAVKKCEDKGITVVCASGNNYQTAFPWVAAPANSFITGEPNSKPIAVGAIQNNLLIANFSSRGTNARKWNPVSVVAPGVGIYSTYLNNGYQTLSGTSMACPHVAGLAALLYQKNPRISISNVKEAINKHAIPLGDSGHNETYGYGLINCDASLK